MQRWLILITLMFGAISPAAAEPKRVLLLHSYGPQFVTLLVKGDRIQLQQVIVNLIVNAIDAMSAMSSAERRNDGVDRA